MGRYLAPILLFSPPTPHVYAHTRRSPPLIRFLLSIPFFPPSTSSVLRRREPRVRRASPLFRHAREPLISADFARRVDPWNPCSCLSPAPARAGTPPSTLLSFSSSVSFSPTHFLLPSFRLDLERKIFRHYCSLSQESGKRIFFFFFIYEDRGIVYCVYKRKTVRCKF